MCLHKFLYEEFAEFSYTSEKDSNSAPRHSAPRYISRSDISLFSRASISKKKSSILSALFQELNLLFEYKNVFIVIFLMAFLKFPSEQRETF